MLGAGNDTEAIRQVDAETGELIEEGFVAYVAPRRQNGFGKRWFAMAHDAAAVLKQVKNLEDFRVLMALLEQLDYENLITTNQAEIARAGWTAAERTAEH